MEDLIKRREELEKEAAALEAQIEELKAKQDAAGVIDDTRILADYFCLNQSIPRRRVRGPIQGA